MDVTQADERTLVDRIVAYDDAWNRHDLAAILAFHTHDSVFQSHTTGELATGKAAIERMITKLFRVFPDLTFTFRRMYARRDLVVQEWTAHATHSCPIPTKARMFPPTGLQLAWDGVDIIPMQGGLIVRKDAYVDSAALLTQLQRASIAP